MATLSALLSTIRATLKRWYRLYEENSDRPTWPFDDAEGEEMWWAGKAAREEQDRADQLLKEAKQLAKGPKKPRYW